MYLVKNRETEELCALKRIRPRTNEELESIKNEIALTQISYHPNIISYYHAFEYQSCIYLALEYMQNSLYEVITENEGNIPEKQIAYICMEILQGLSFMHRQNRIHRDIKSDNILINSKGDIKLGDFGYAAQLTLEQSNRNTIVGTPSWMAPEIVKGETYGCSIDIWSFGILVIELAEGEPPYIDDPPMKAMFNIATKPPPTLRDKFKWSSEFREFLGICLVKEPERRASVSRLLSHPFLEYNVGESAREEFVEFLGAS